MKKSHNRKKVKTSRRRFIKHDIVTNFPVPQMGAPPKPHQDIKDRLNIIFADKQQTAQQDDQSCVLCKKGQISTEYELCSSCETITLSFEQGLEVLRDIATPVVESQVGVRN